MLRGNVIPAGVVLNKTAVIVKHIAAGGVVAVLVDPHIPPVCLIVDIVNEMLRDLNGAEVLDVHSPQRLVIVNIGVKLKAIQILRQVD